MENGTTVEEIREINELQREFFNRRVNIFEPPLPEGVPERLKMIVKAADIKEGETVLDVGTGSGILIYDILEYDPGEVHGCDLAENMLKRVKEKFPQVMIHLCDIRDLDLPDGSVDVVFINGCFSNIVDKEKSLKNLHRMMRSGGRLAISHPMGKDFILELRTHAPFPLDLLPEEPEAREIFWMHGFDMIRYEDEPEFYLALAIKR